MRTSGTLLLAATCFFIGACGGPDGGSAGSATSIVGTYVVDAEAMRPVAEKAVAKGLEAEKRMLEAAPAEQRAQLEAGFGAQQQKRLDEFMSRLTFEATVAADGTFVVVDGGQVTARGTWQLEGSKFTVTTTEANGVKLTPPDGFVGTYVDGRVRYRPGGQTPFDIIMRPK